VRRLEKGWKWLSTRDAAASYQFVGQSCGLGRVDKQGVVAISETQRGQATYLQRTRHWFG
ncbi:MAG: hypothetical protein KDA65_19960, partial [Planctomycetaceae bacterium]|nr:hypothetical protein [Planctomycetaceae bacterium]